MRSLLAAIHNDEDVIGFKVRAAGCTGTVRRVKTEIIVSNAGTKQLALSEYYVSFSGAGSTGWYHVSKASKILEG